MIEANCPDCGCVFAFEAKAKAKPRSHPQLKRFHALMRATFDHWPETHKFRPRNVDHLRFWLECEAGHCTVEKTIRCQSVDAAKLYAVIKAVMDVSDDVRQFVDMDDDVIVVRRALSISYATLAHLAACRLFSDVDDVIKAETGMDPEQLLREHGRAA